MGGGGGGNNPATQFSPQAGQQAMDVSGDLVGFSQKGLRPQFQFQQDLINPYASQILNTAFDPQQQLYNRTLGQVTDQTRHGEAARGVADTPYGAAAEGNALSNFNIDWGNQQLQRQSEGLGSATGALGGIMQSGVQSAIPEQAGLQGFLGLEEIASQAQTAQNQMKQQQQQSEMGMLGQAGGALGGLMGK